MHPLFRLALPVALLLLLAASSPGGDLPAAEKQKIESLIKRVEGLKGAVFIRNGREYDAATAARFLRGKWQANADEIKTARGFVEKVATASSTTGRPYLIRLKGGKDQKSGEYLLKELKKLESPPEK